MPVQPSSIRAFLPALPAGKASLNRYFDAAIAADRLYGLSMDGLWLTVGTPAAIGDAEAAIARQDGING